MADHIRARITEELRQITAILEEITNRTSRWNGTVELVRDAGFKGLKPFHCSIFMAEDLAEEDVRWRTLIHEALHALSAGYNSTDFEANRGWEEGTVEQLQRLIRPIVLARMKVLPNEAAMMQIEENHLFNAYIKALEDVREALGRENQEFYLTLLKTPIRDRYTLCVQAAISSTGDNRRKAVEVLSAASPILKGRLL